MWCGGPAQRSFWYLTELYIQAMSDGVGEIEAVGLAEDIVVLNQCSRVQWLRWDPNRAQAFEQQKIEQQNSTAAGDGAAEDGAAENDVRMAWVYCQSNYSAEQSEIPYYEDSVGLLLADSARNEWVAQQPMKKERIEILKLVDDYAVDGASGDASRGSEVVDVAMMMTGARPHTRSQSNPAERGRRPAVAPQGSSTTERQSQERAERVARRTVFRTPTPRRYRPNDFDGQDDGLFSDGSGDGSQASFHPSHYDDDTDASSLAHSHDAEGSITGSTMRAEDDQRGREDMVAHLLHEWLHIEHSEAQRWSGLDFVEAVEGIRVRFLCWEHTSKSWMERQGFLKRKVEKNATEELFGVVRELPHGLQQAMQLWEVVVDDDDLPNVRSLSFNNVMKVPLCQVRYEGAPVLAKGVKVKYVDYQGRDPQDCNYFEHDNYNRRGTVHKTFYVKIHHLNTLELVYEIRPEGAEGSEEGIYDVSRLTTVCADDDQEQQVVMGVEPAYWQLSSHGLYYAVPRGAAVANTGAGGYISYIAAQQRVSAGHAAGHARVSSRFGVRLWGETY